MSYADKTVKELRAIAEGRGLKVPKSAKKGDIVAMLETDDGPIEVEANVVENSLAISSKSLAIDANGLVSKIGEITEAIDELEKVKEEMDATPETIASMSLDDVAICRKGLARAIKAADEKRLEFGRILREPIDLVNARCKELTKEANELADRYRAREKRAEEDRRIDRKNELREHYECYAGVLPDVVPYDKLHDDRWLNKGCNVEEAKAELESKVDALARDWKSLRSMGLEFVSEAEARLFDSLDLGEAIAWAGKLAEDKRKIDAMKAELGPREGPAEEAAADDSMPLEAYEAMYDPEADAPAAQIPADSITTAAPAMPIPADDKGAVIAEIASLLEWYDLAKLKNLRTALRNARDPQGEATERVMVITAATQGQLDVIGKFCGLAGVTGTFKSGSLAEVMQRERQRAMQARGQVYGYGA